MIYPRDLYVPHLDAILSNLGKSILIFQLRQPLVVSGFYLEECTCSYHNVVAIIVCLLSLLYLLKNNRVPFKPYTYFPSSSRVANGMGMFCNICEMPKFSTLYPSDAISFFFFFCITIDHLIYLFSTSSLPDCYFCSMWRVYLIFFNVKYLWTFFHFFIVNFFVPASC